MDYDWPGNVWEMKNILERAVILQKGSVLRPSELLGKPSDRQKKIVRESTHEEDVMSLEELEKLHIQRTLQKCSGNVAQTARILCISLSTMKRKVKQYGLK